MPTARPRPCSHPGCPNMKPCPKHARPKQASWSPESRGTSNDRGYGAAWTKVRMHVIYRDRVCCFCGESVMGEDNRPLPGTTVHHIIPKPHGTDDESNLSACHKRCHVDFHLRTR